MVQFLVDEHGTRRQDVVGVWGARSSTLNTTNGRRALTRDLWPCSMLPVSFAYSFAYCSIRLSPTSKFPGTCKSPSPSKAYIDSHSHGKCLAEYPGDCICIGRWPLPKGWEPYKNYLHIWISYPHNITHTLNTACVQAYILWDYLTGSNARVPADTLSRIPPKSIQDREDA